MLINKLRKRAREEKGFTLIELLVVILIIGILAAIAIPSFLNQKSKANDASAKELARTAQTTMETVATDNNGAYTAVTAPAGLAAVEPSINTNSSTGSAYLSVATGTTPTGGWTVTATSVPTNNTFTITRSANGIITHTCTVATPGNNGGCSNPSSTTAGW